MSAKYSRLVPSPIGPILLVADDEALIEAKLWQDWSMPVFGNQSSSILDAAQERLTEYFAGDTSALTEVPVRLQGTEFQEKVWRILQTIPAGDTKTYGEVAAQAGTPNGARASGNACNKNPLLLFVPCHRVVGQQGALTGFAVGLDTKKFLLAHEGVVG